MKIINKIFGEKSTGDADGYIDLEKYTESTGGQTQQGAKMFVRVGEIQRYEDLKEFIDYVYGGNVLILDFSQIADEEVILKRITNDLKKMAGEINGDIALHGPVMQIASRFLLCKCVGNLDLGSGDLGLRTQPRLDLVAQRRSIPRPVPAAHLSFIRKFVTLPLSSQCMALQSCPPISKIVLTVGPYIKLPPRA